MRASYAIVLAASLICSNAFAASQTIVPQPPAPLPAGKPAGVKGAALLGPQFMLILLSAGIAIGGIALAVSSPGNNGVTTPTTTATSP